MLMSLLCRCCVDEPHSVATVEVETAVEERSVAADKVEVGRWRRRDVAIDAVEVVEAGGGKFHHFASHSLSPVTWPSMGAMRRLDTGERSSKHLVTYTQIVGLFSKHKYKANCPL